jgi:hypothetical protein
VSGLDDKLKAIVLAGPNGEHGHLSTEEIDQIRQAFESDSLYRTVKAYKDAGGDMDEVIVMSHKDIDRNIALNNLMTGQEWYERFIKEVKHELGYTDEQIGAIDYRYSVAARRAAGIDMATLSPDTTSDLSNPPESDK